MMISVIIPVYNAEETLEKCILSVRNQTYEKIEIILVNDGSVDNSLSICKIHSQEDSRVKVINKKNGGVSVARNTGLSNAIYPYIIFVDSDDFIEPTMCEKLINGLSDKSIDLVVCGYYVHQNKDISKVEYNDKVYSGIESLKYDFSSLYIRNFFNSPVNKLYKKDLINNYFIQDLSLGEDLLFNLDYLRNVSKIKSINDVLYHYNINTDNSSLSTKFYDNSFEIANLLYTKVNEFCETNGITYNFRGGVRYQYFATIYYNIQRLIYYSGQAKSKIISVISTWVNYKDVKDVIYNLGKIGIQLEVGKLMFISRNPLLIYYFFKVKKVLAKTNRAIKCKKII